MTADQYVVAELLQVKAELEDAKKTINHLSSANTYLTIENVKLESNLRDIRKCFGLGESSFKSNYIQVRQPDGSYCGIFVWQSDKDFQEWLKLLDLEQEYAKLSAKSETQVDPNPDQAPTEPTTPTETKEGA